MKQQQIIGASLSLGILLLFIATQYYPGGSQVDPHSMGFHWAHNYLSNLFDPIAVNGMPNTARWWAVAGMMAISMGGVLFFSDFSKKITEKTSSKVIRYGGWAAMVCSFLAVTPLHDSMITIGSVFGLLSMFYIAVFVFRSKLYLLKILCTLALLAAYTTNYLYYTRTIEWLPIAQKVSFLLTMLLILGLTYFTKVEDFNAAKK